MILILDRITQHGAPIMANPVRALLSKLFNFAIGRDLVEHNPCLAVPRPGKERQRDRVLSEGEIRTLWQTLDGYEPVMAADGVEGVALSARHHPRLILMDLQMPRLDGFAAAAEINRTAGEPSPVIVAVTANAGADVRAACRDAGFAGVLAKPVMLDELIATVRRFLPG